MRRCPGLLPPATRHMTSPPRPPVPLVCTLALHGSAGIAASPASPRAAAAAPPPPQGKHRYVFVLFRQPNHNYM